MCLGLIRISIINYRILFHHLEYLEDQMDIVKTVNLCMANDIPHEDLLECLRKKINAPLTIKQMILYLVKNYTMFGGGDLNHIENVFEPNAHRSK